MDLLEIEAIAQVLGAVAILLSLIFVIIELRKNLKQNNIGNSLVRAIEREKFNYMQMEEGKARLIARAKSSYKIWKVMRKFSLMRLCCRKYPFKFGGTGSQRRRLLNLGQVV